jgi:aminoglycoside phosphotransferase (APT) family kinase protein
LPDLFVLFLDRYGDQLSDDVRDVVSQLHTLLGAYSAFAPGRRCVQHGDFRTDNLLFESFGGDQDVTVVDWQTVSVGSGFLDVAYFLTTSVTPEALVEWENELLTHYLAELASPKVTWTPARGRA